MASMRFATLEINGRATVAAVSDDGQRYCEANQLVPGFNGDMTGFIKSMPSVTGTSVRTEAWQPIAGKKLLAPIPLPQRNIFCVGKNYHEHAREFSQSGFD